ncbi:MAG: tyrosine-type recombinase/integrase [Thiothrix sp.]
MAVSDSKLRTAKPQEQNYRIQIGGNTYLDVLTTGRKVWRMRFNHPTSKKPAIYTIGDYPDIPLADVGDLAKAAKKLVKAGVDPTAHRKAEKQREEQERIAALRALADSFESVARSWHKHRNETMKKWKPAHAEKIMVMLEADVFPSIGAMNIADVTAPRLLEVVQAIIDRGALETAKKVNRYLNAVFRYAVTRKLVKHNEADNLRDEIPTAKTVHNPHLTVGEMPEFIRAVRNDSVSGEVLKIAVQITMHTLCRTNEIRFAKWAEFDMEARLWTIPGDRMKMKKTHVIPLSDQVMELLERLKPFTGQYRYLFTIRTTGKPMSENGMLSVLKRLNYKGRLTMHGLRGTGSTILNEAGFRGDVIETALAHKEKNAIRGAYNHAVYLEERREMLQWYSDHLDALAEGAQIIPIQRKRG